VWTCSLILRITTRLQVHVYVLAMSYTHGGGYTTTHSWKPTTQHENRAEEISRRPAIFGISGFMLWICNLLSCPFQGTCIWFTISSEYLIIPSKAEYTMIFLVLVACSKNKFNRKWRKFLESDVLSWYALSGTCPRSLVWQATKVKERIFCLR